MFDNGAVQRMVDGRLRPRRQGSRVRDRGVTLVEFAIVAPVFLLLLLGMIDFGFAFGDYISMRNGVREGARQAVINPPGTATCTLDTPPPNVATRNLACVTKDRIGISEDDVQIAIVLLDGDDPGSTPGEAGDPVRICARTPTKSTSGMTAPFLSGRSITATVEMRIEVTPSFQNYSEGGLSCS